MDADDVTITSTAASDDGKSVVVQYAVTGIAKNKEKKAKQTLQLASTSSAIEDSLKDEGYKKVDVSYADAEITTVTIVSDSGNDDKSGDDSTGSDDNTSNDDDMTDAPAVVATQSFTGVTVADASEPAFETALETAVAEELGVDADDVTITSIAAGYDGNVVVQYAVTGDPPFLATYISTHNPRFTD